jgi:hypothetical protein
MMRGLFRRGVEDAHARQVAVIGGWADHSQHAVSAQREVPPAVLPDDPASIRLGVPGRPPQQDDRVNLRPGQHVPHVLIGYELHLIPLAVLPFRPGAPVSSRIAATACRASQYHELKGSTLGSGRFMITGRNGQ